MAIEPRAVGGARARASTAADSSEPSAFPAQTQRLAFRVVVSRALWKGADVTVEPATTTHPMRHFRSHGEALIFAEQLAALNGWPLFDLWSVDSGEGR